MSGWRTPLFLLVLRVAALAYDRPAGAVVYGGPVWSLAMLAENRPCKVCPGIATETDPYSWTAQANVV
ncbi:hypothetical protein ON010_g15804 [Phytophthora cinnamomi]|nr:hypothetical protein ON010_g15804 [Phytophthora cinnamomi]